MIRLLSAAALLAVLGAVLPPAALAATAAATAAAEDVAPGVLVVDLGEDADAGDRVAAAVPSGSVEPLAVDGFVRVTVPAAVAEQTARRLSSLPDVAAVEPDPVAAALDFQPTDPLWPDQWAARKIAAPAAWDVTLGIPRTVVAVLDTGVQLEHPELSGALLPGIDLVTPGGAARDRNGHGTEVAGVVVGRHNNGIGGTGICPRCALLPVKVLDDTGHSPLSRIAEGIVLAADRGARVINLSLGSYGGSSALEAAVQHARAKGAVVVAAAGNYGDTSYATEPLYPAAYSGVISVAGSDPQDRRYSWSSYGSWVRVAAPGCSVTARYGGDVGTVCGSSLAAPVVAGVLGLAASVHSGVPRAVLEGALLGTAVPVGGYVTRGRIAAAATLRATSLLAGYPAVAPRWSGWAGQPGSGLSAPGVVSWAAGRSDVFAVDGSGRLVHRWLISGQGWGPAGSWRVLGHPSGVRLVGQPTAVSQEPGSLDVFVRGADDALWQRSYRPAGGWTGWMSRGGVLGSAPSAVSWGPGHVAVFVTSKRGVVWERSWGGSWLPWRSVGGPVTSAPGVVAWQRGRIDVFARGAAGQLMHRWYLRGWGPWVSRGGVLMGDGRPGAVSWGQGRLDVFVMGGLGVYRRGYQEGLGWVPVSGWERLGSPSGVTLRSGTAALSWEAGHMEVFASDTSGRIWHRRTS